MSLAGIIEGVYEFQLTAEGFYVLSGWVQEDDRWQDPVEDYLYKDFYNVRCFKIILFSRLFADKF